MNDEELNQQLRAMVDAAAAPLSQTEVVLRASSPARKSRRDWHLTEHRLIVVAVAAAIVVVFFVPLPSLSLFNRLTTGSPTTPSTFLPHTGLPSVDQSATPPGWVPIAYKDAQMSIPASWFVRYRTAPCLADKPSGQAPSGEAFVNPLRGVYLCPHAVLPQTIVWLRAIPTNAKGGVPEVINGITVYPYPAGQMGSYLVPSLGVEITAMGRLARQVLHTLSVSPRSVVLANGPAPVVPPTWRTLSFSGVNFAVPATWPVIHYDTYGPPCGGVSPVYGTTGVFLDTDSQLAVSHCGELGYLSPKQATDGLSINRIPTQFFPASTRYGKCLKVHGLTACPATSYPYSFLVLRVTVPGRSKPVIVSIGLAGNGMISRTILYSLRPATTVATASADLKAFYALARKGLEEPFQASYRLTYPKGSARSHFDFQVWSEPEVPNKTQGDFVYQSAFGHGTFRYIRKHGVDYACVQRTAKSLWKCVGPYGPDSIGQIMQVEQFRLPMFTVERILGADYDATSVSLSHRIVLGRRLWCLTYESQGGGGVTWCLSSDGPLAFGESFGGGGTSEMEAVALSLSNAKAVFVPPSKPEPLKHGPDGGPPPICDGSFYLCPSPGLSV